MGGRWARLSPIPLVILCGCGVLWRDPGRSFSLSEYPGLRTEYDVPRAELEGIARSAGVGSLYRLSTVSARVGSRLGSGVADMRVFRRAMFGINPLPGIGRFESGDGAGKESLRAAEFIGERGRPDGRKRRDAGEVALA